jgi:hypothetical protein
MAARALWLAAALAAGACQRLNPDWCASAARCAAGQVCDPATNTCVALEAGARFEARLGDRAGSEPRPPPDGALALDRGPHDRAPVSCAGANDGWICVGGEAWHCGEAGAQRRRLCPLGQCANGHCQPSSSSSSCKSNKDCAGLGSWLCTLLLDQGKSTKQLCAAPVGGMVAAICTSGAVCATGLCTSAGQCYHACDENGDCPSGYQCNSAAVNVEGVVVSRKSCEQS